MVVTLRPLINIEMKVPSSRVSWVGVSDVRAVEDEIPSFRPVGDRGGATSYYIGDVPGISEIAIVFENLTNGRPAEEGLNVFPANDAGSLAGRLLVDSSD